jgi:hypothetical protein
MKTTRLLLIVAVLQGCLLFSHAQEVPTWIKDVPEMLEPVQKPPPERPVLPKPLSERTDQFDAIILGSPLRTRVQEGAPGEFIGIIVIRVQEVLKGKKAKSDEELAIVLYKSRQRSALEKVVGDEKGFKRGIWGLRELPEGSPFPYVRLWFHGPSGEDWEPVLGEFRKDVKNKGSAQHPPERDK